MRRIIPLCIISSAGSDRVYRGGSWLVSNARNLRSSFRVNYRPVLMNGYLGLRLVRRAP